MPVKKVQIQLEQGAGFKAECHAGKHTVFIDQPVVAGGTDAGPTPLDYQLITLAGCIGAIGRIIANQRRLPVRAFRISVAGEVNTDKLLGKSDTDRAGFSAITATVEIDADMTHEEKAALLHEIDERCPISENLKNPTPVQINLAG